MFYKLLLIPILVGPMLVIGGYILYKYPPKKINGLYGYRTPASMKSNERWSFAQNMAASEMMKLGVLLICTSCFSLIIKINEAWAAFIGLSFMLTIFGLLLTRVERAIKRKFDTN